MPQIWKEFCTEIEIHGNYNNRAEFVIFPDMPYLQGQIVKMMYLCVIIWVSIIVDRRRFTCIIPEEDMIFLQWEKDLYEASGRCGLFKQFLNAAVRTWDQYTGIARKEAVTLESAAEHSRYFCCISYR